MKNLKDLYNQVRINEQKKALFEYYNKLSKEQKQQLEEMYYNEGKREDYAKNLPDLPGGPIGPRIVDYFKNLFGKSSSPDPQAVANVSRQKTIEDNLKAQRTKEALERSNRREVQPNAIWDYLKKAEAEIPTRQSEKPPAAGTAAPRPAKDLEAGDMRNLFAQGPDAAKRRQAEIDSMRKLDDMESAARIDKADAAFKKTSQARGKRKAAEDSASQIDMPKQNVGNLRARELEIAAKKQAEADAAFKKTSEDIGARRAADAKAKQDAEAAAVPRLRSDTGVKRAETPIGKNDSPSKSTKLRDTAIAAGVAAGAMALAPNQAGDAQADDPQAQIQAATAGAKTFAQAHRLAREKAKELGVEKSGQFVWGPEGEPKQKYQTNLKGERYVPLKKQTKVNIESVDETLLAAFNKVVNSKHPNLFAEAKKGKDHDADGDKDFADVMIARMVASGMSKEEAIAKVKSKTYNEGVLGIPAKKPTTSTTSAPEKGSEMPGYGDEGKPYTDIKPMPKNLRREEIDPKERPRKDPHAELDAGGDVVTPVIPSQKGMKPSKIEIDPKKKETTVYKQRAVEEVEELDERNKENKKAKDAYMTRVGNAARKAGDPKHLTNIGTGMRTSVANKIRGRQLSKEEVELDEVLDTDEKKMQYAKKASDQIKAYKERGGAYDMSEKGEKDTKGVEKRTKGLQRLIKKIQKKTTNEEVEFSESELAYFASILEYGPTPEDHAPNPTPGNKAEGGKGGGSIAEKAKKPVHEEIEELDEGRGKGSGRGRPKGAKSGSQHGGGEAAGTPHIVDQIKHARARGIADGKGNYMLKHPVSGETKAVPQSSANRFYMEYHNSSKPDAKNKALSAFYAKHGFSNTEAESAPKEDPKKRTTLEPKKTGITLASVPKPKS